MVEQGMPEVNPWAIIGEKQVKLEIMAQYAQGLEQKVLEQQATIDRLGVQIVELQTPPEVAVSEVEDMVSEGSPVK